jgi:hypothetical protein
MQSRVTTSTRPVTFLIKSVPASARTHWTNAV